MNIPLQAINDAVTKNHGIHLFILRTDLNHPHISGNKLFKLKYNLLEAEKKNIKTLLTFGGAFSNHISATAAAGKEYGVKTIGIIRGEPYPVLNPTLQFAMECGMELHYVPRILYRNKKELYDYVYKQFLQETFYLIPEGGSNELGVLGCKEITGYINTDFDYVCSPCGTGATITGIVLSLKNNQKAIGFQILKAEGYIKNEVEEWLKKEPNIRLARGNNESGNDIGAIIVQNNWSINENYHFGGYAKTQTELTGFINWFEETNHVPLDFIYTGKMMFGIYDMIGKGFFKKGETIVAVHTGGLQGNAGVKFLSGQI
ncbi:MAG: pyridoxal-phosphate dependent enzyme [Bacteroidetes bacterium]|nr:pyridoxal-phosphate dependent enzyme [Bacteroidota bacterium]